MEMKEFVNLIMGNLPEVILIMTVLLLAALLLFISINLKLARLNKRYETMMKGMDGVNLEKLLMEHIEEVRRTGKKCAELEVDAKAMRNQLIGCVQRCGVVRFNAFPDIASDLSFAIALLDENNDGVIFSSIYGRSESRTYAKPIKNGASSYLLSGEEQEALKIAMEKKPV